MELHWCRHRLRAGHQRENTAQRQSTWGEHGRSVRPSDRTPTNSSPSGPKTTSSSRPHPEARSQTSPRCCMPVCARSRPDTESLTAGTTAHSLSRCKEEHSTGATTRSPQGPELADSSRCQRGRGMERSPTLNVGPHPDDTSPTRMWDLPVTRPADGLGARRRTAWATPLTVAAPQPCTANHQGYGRRGQTHRWGRWEDERRSWDGGSLQQGRSD